MGKEYYHCPGCNAKLVFPLDVKAVRCPKCSGEFEIYSLKKVSINRGWKFAIPGLLLAVHPFFLSPLAERGVDIPLLLGFDSYGSYIITMMFTMLFGTLLASYGLVLSISDKHNVGRKNFILEIILLLLMIWEAFLMLTFNGY